MSTIRCGGRARGGRNRRVPRLRSLLHSIGRYLPQTRYLRRRRSSLDGDGDGDATLSKHVINCLCDSSIQQGLLDGGCFRDGSYDRLFTRMVCLLLVPAFALDVLETGICFNRTNAFLQGRPLFFGTGGGMAMFLRGQPLYYLGGRGLRTGERTAIDAA